MTSIISIKVREDLIPMIIKNWGNSHTTGKPLTPVEEQTIARQLAKLSLPPHIVAEINKLAQV